VTWQARTMLLLLTPNKGPQAKDRP